MDDQQIQRIELIMNYKLSPNKSKKTPEKEYKLAVFMLFFSFICILSALFCVWQATGVIFNITEENINWFSFSTASTTAFSFAYLLVFPREFSNFLLKKHLIRVIKNKPTVDEGSNTKLRNTIIKITDKKTNLPYFILPMLLIIGGLFEMLKLNPIWETFAYIAPLSLISIIFKIVKDYRSIKSCTSINSL